MGKKKHVRLRKALARALREPGRSVTLDRLAEMVERGFEETRKDVADGREEARNLFHGLDRKLDALELKVDGILKRLVENHEERIGRLEAKLLR